jgi:hypothetical protein
VSAAATASRPATAPGGVRGDGSTGGRTAAAWWRRWRLPIAVGLLIVLVALLIAASVSTPSRFLDPGSANPGGARALARILAPRGVEVRQATRFDQLAAAAQGDDVTVLVTAPDLLGLAKLRRLRTMATDLVLVEPNAVTLEQLAPAVRPAGVASAEVVAPGCDASVADAGRALGGGHLYRSGGDATICYRLDDAGSVALTSVGGTQVTVLGQAAILTNERLAEDGNAALAMRVLGHNRLLVWYLPDPVADGEGDGQGPDLMQVLDERAPWLGWVQLQLLFVLLVALVWRARRLGRLVTEPLPVVVRSAETQEGRARLYRRARARGRAAATLRTAALRRIARQLAVPLDAGLQQVAELTAAATGRPVAGVAELIAGAAPVDDAALVRLAAELDALEAAVGRGANRPGWQ